LYSQRRNNARRTCLRRAWLAVLYVNAWEDHRAADSRRVDCNAEEHSLWRGADVHWMPMCQSHSQHGTRRGASELLGSCTAVWAPPEVGATSRSRHMTGRAPRAHAPISSRLGHAPSCPCRYVIVVTPLWSRQRVVAQSPRVPPEGSCSAMLGASGPILSRTRPSDRCVECCRAGRCLQRAVVTMVATETV